MNNKQLTTYSLIILVIIAGIIYQTSFNKKTDNKGTNMLEHNKDSDDSSMINNKDTNDNNTQKTMMNNRYIDYSVNALEDASNNGKVVLFFHATWCPTCKQANKEFTSRPNDIPEGVTVIKTDYDTHKDLRSKYGLTQQHTFVQIDKDGNELKKWIGGDIEELKNNIM